MIKIKIDNTNYNIPSDWCDVKLEQYEQWFDSNIITKEDEVIFISKVSSIPLNVLKSLPVDFYNELTQMVGFALTDEKFKMNNSIVIDDINYSISYQDKLTLAEWVDTDAVLQGEENKLSSVLAIVCRPTGEKYNPDNLPERIELFKGLSMDKVFPLFSFFLTLNEVSTMIINHSLKVEGMVNQLHLNIQTSLKNGGGIKRWQNLRMTIYNKWIRLQNWVLSKCSTSYHTK